MKKILSLVLVFVMVSACFAVSNEVNVESHNFWQEFDIIFFQSLPFAALWGHFLDQQVSTQLAVGSAPHWSAIVAFATLVSAANATLHAREIVRLTKPSYIVK